MREDGPEYGTGLNAGLTGICDGSGRVRMRDGSDSRGNAGHMELPKMVSAKLRLNLVHEIGTASAFEGNVINTVGY